MFKQLATTLTVSIGLLTVALPIAASLFVAHRQSMNEVSTRALAMAADVSKRTDNMGDQAMSAYRRLHRLGLANPCSAKGLALMREISLDSNYLQSVGYVLDQRLSCSSFGDHGKGIPLGPSVYTSTIDAHVRPSVHMGPGATRGLLVLEKDHFAALIHPDTLLDGNFDMPVAGIGIVGRNSGLRMASRGAFDPAWPARLGDARQTTFFDGRHLVAMQRSGKYDMFTYVAIPASYLATRLRAFTIVLVPLGAILGLAMLLAIRLLARQQASMPAALRGGLKRREFVLHYQPIVSLTSGRMVGVEVLMRWPRPDQVEIGPGLFIPAAEQCGLIQQFTAYVLAQVAVEGPAFLARHGDCYISINLSASDLHGDEIIVALRRLAATPGITSCNLLVEVTEHSFVDAARAGHVINAIRALGIRVAIDDFGTGYSNLSQLTAFKTDLLKIDKVFIEAIGTGSATSEVALHIIRIAQTLQLTMIAEGVETQAQADFLREHGVEFGQGWLFGRPVPMVTLLSGVAK